MKKTENLYISYSNKAIAKNTLFNLLGNVVPMLFALFFIPPLIKSLGVERFGILGIAWMIIGYFSFFDFGIGKGLTKIIAERIGLNQTDQIPKIFWTSLLLMISLSLLLSFILSFFIPSLTGIFSISEHLKQESEYIFYILAFSIPLVTTMAGLRGVLEAYQKFATINIIKSVLGIFVFLGPFIVLIITDSLFWIVVFLIFTRVMIWIFYLIQCLKVNKSIKKEIKIDFNSIRPVLRFSIWITVANIVVPLIFYSDRILIGALISASAITYYITPYEVITKLMLIPDALSGVLFPVFSASFLSKPDIAKNFFLRGAKFIFLILYPIVFLVTTFSFEGIEFWLGEKFAQTSSLILQLLAIGVMMNCISLIPTNFFQGIGKPKIPTIIILIELPFYLSAMWFAIDYAGINGAAMVFMIAATINVLILYLTAYKLYSLRFKSTTKELLIVPLMIVLAITFLLNDVYLKIIFALCFLVIYSIITWMFFLSTDEKFFIISKLRLKFK